MHLMACIINICDPGPQKSRVSVFLFFYTSSESWVNKLTIDVWFVKIIFNIWPRYNYLEIWNLRVQNFVLNIEKTVFKIVFKMHITTKKLCFDMFTVGHLQNIFMEHHLYLSSFLAKNIQSQSGPKQQCMQNPCLYQNIFFCVSQKE